MLSGSIASLTVRITLTEPDGEAYPDPEREALRPRLAAKLRQLTAGEPVQTAPIAPPGEKRAATSQAG